MLSLFPELLFLAPFSALLLRLALAAICALSAWAHLGRSQNSARAWGVLEMALAAALIAGAWTQAVALIAIVWLLASLYVRDIRMFPKSTVVLALIIALSLLVTGPGAFAFDLPL